MKAIRVEWYDSWVGSWVRDMSFDSLAQALAYAHEEVQRDTCGEDHRVIVDGQVYALIHALGGEE